MSLRSHSSGGTPTTPRFGALEAAGPGGRFYDLDLDKVLAAMEKGNRICKLALNKRWDPGYRRMCLNRETRQLLMWKTDNLTAKNITKPCAVDIRTVKEVMTLDFKVNKLKLGDKWKRDKEIQQFDPAKILIIAFGSNFTFNYWICLFDTPDACQMWVHGVRYLMLETSTVPHPLVIERWLRKQFYEIVNPATQCVAIKHMKPFIQTKLQYKVTCKDLQDISEDQLPFEAFALAYRNLIHLDSLIDNEEIKLYSNDGNYVDFDSFLRFLLEQQKDKMGNQKDRTSEFLRRYLKDVDATRDTAEPFLTVQEFLDYLFSRENSIWDTANDIVSQDMDRPLCDYWIASSHNTYLTGDQLKSDSSLDAYAKALLMGCRCIELDCWDPRRESDNDIVIWHGFTLTTKLNLKDVLITIREFAFVTSDYPVILSIEDNCTVPSQRVMASQLKEYLGDLLLTTPISKDENELPSPNQLKRKIILKHKKLPTDKESSVGSSVLSSPTSFEDSLQDQDISISADVIKKGVLSLRDRESEEWTTHLFVLLPDRLCYTLEGQYDGTDTSVEQIDGNDLHDTMSQFGDEEVGGFGVRPEEMHVTEEWFHGKIAREEAVTRLKKHKDKGDGLFLIRDSTVFIGDYSLSFLYQNDVHHCRIRTRMVDGEKRYYFVESKQMDTLYELITYYTRHSLSTPKFRTQLNTPCPQPQPHIGQPWYNGDIGKDRSEELLNQYREDGAFLIRLSSSDKNVFVISWRVDGEIFHMRLKRDGRIFVVNSTVFETLNQIVEYYQTRDLYRGVCLKYPVNEETAAEMSRSVSEPTYTPEGCYLALNSLDKEQLTVRVYGVRQEDTVSVQRGVVVVDRSLVLIKPKPELKKQDRIVAVNQTKCSTAQEAMELLLKQGQGPFELTVDRGPVDHKTRLVVEVMRKQGQAWGLGCTEDKDKREVRVSSLSGVATEANLEEDDHILSINDKRITSLQDLREVAAKADKLTIQIDRSPADSESESEGEEEEASESEDEDLDLMTITITKRPGQPVGLGCKEDKKDQVHISSLSGLAKETNLKVGDKIVTLNGKKVESLEALRNLVGSSQQLTIQVGRSKEEEKKEEKPKPTPPPPVRLPDRTPSMEKITTPGAGQADTEEVNLELQCDEGEPIGVYPDENLKIVRIQTGSIGAQKFKMGDIIKKVNKWPITDVNHFFTAIERSPRPLHVTVNRSVSREKEAKLKQLPAHLEKLVRRHSGFDYMMLDVSFDEKAGKHFGLALANCAHNKVLVTGMKDGSVSADHFKIFDRIVAINGTPVTDENVAKSYICASAGNFQELLVRSQFPFIGRPDCQELSFQANAIITIIDKDDNKRMWKGRLNGAIGWFPKEYVTEINNKQMEESKEYAFVELAGAIVETVDISDRPFVFRVVQSHSHWSEQELIVCAETGLDMNQWINDIKEVKDKANRHVSSLRSKEKNMRIASELSNLVVYCQAVPFNPDKIPGNFYEMCSVSETKHDKLVEKGLLRFNRHQISRIYPMATRLKSNNFCPIQMWNTGCQMVALNYQTPDRSMQLNQGRFLANGRCGFVLKPPFMRMPNYDPESPINLLDSTIPITLTVRVIAGRHLYRKDRTRGIVSPCVEVEITGLNCDNQVQRTNPATSDGLHPIWDHQFEFNIRCPELALLRFYVEDGDFVKTDPFIGQAVFPVTGIRTGYRSVPLHNGYSEELELSSLLVHVNLRSQGIEGEHVHEVSRSRFYPSSSQLNETTVSDGHPSKNSTLTSTESTPFSPQLSVDSVNIGAPLTPVGSSPSLPLSNGLPPTGRDSRSNEPVKKKGSKSSSSSLKKLFRLGSGGSKK